MNVPDAAWAQIVADYGFERVWMWSLALQYPGGAFGEIGMGNGRSTRLFADAARHVGGRVYSMDRAPQDVDFGDLARYVRVVKGDSATAEFPVPLDLLFIDGDHCLAAVERDFNRHIGAVKSKGWIFIHDVVNWRDPGEFCNNKGIFQIPVTGTGIGIFQKR